MKVKVLIENLNGKTVFDSMEEFFSFVFAGDKGNVFDAHTKAEFIYEQLIISHLGQDPLLELLRTFSCSYAVFWAVVASPVAPKMVTDHWTATVYRDILTVNPVIQRLDGEEARKLYEAKTHTGSAEKPDTPQEKPTEETLRRKLWQLIWRF